MQEAPGGQVWPEAATPEVLVRRPGCSGGPRQWWEWQTVLGLEGSLVQPGWEAWLAVSCGRGHKAALDMWRWSVALGWV